jgi:DNA mismatch repair protein MutS
VTPLTRDVFDGATAERRLCDYFAVATMDGLRRDVAAGATAAAAAVTYIDRTQVGKRPPLSPPEREAAGTTMAIDPATRANLELDARWPASARLAARCDRPHGHRGGSRLLAQRLAAPLTDSAAIARRLDAIAPSSPTAPREDDPRDHAARRARHVARAGAAVGRRGGPRDLAGCATASSPPIRRWRGSAQLEAPPPESPP